VILEINQNAFLLLLRVSELNFFDHFEPMKNSQNDKCENNLPLAEPSLSPASLGKSASEDLFAEVHRRMFAFRLRDYCFSLV
jgi:hypothetical protein